MGKMYFMFKNDARRKSLIAANSTLRIFIVLSLIASVIGIVLAFGAMILYLMLFLLTFSLFFQDQARTAAWNNFIGKSALAAGIAIGVFILVFVLRFVIEWMSIINESRELNMDPDLNKNYLAVARIVKKVKLFNIVFKLAALAFLIGLAALVSNNVNAAQWYVYFIFLLFALACLIANKVFASKQFKKVKPEIAAIQAERSAARQMQYAGQAQYMQGQPQFDAGQGQYIQPQFYGGQGQDPNAPQYQAPQQPAGQNQNMPQQSGQCPYCGHKNKPGSEFCKKCGVKLK